MARSVAPTTFLLFLFLLVVLFVSIQLQAIGIVLDKLGLSPHGAALLLFGSLFGSALNIPLFYLHSPYGWQAQPPAPITPFWQRYLRPGYTLLTLNVGGALIPIVFSLYLVLSRDLPVLQLVAAIAGMSLLSFAISRPIEGLGIGMPILMAPIAAALTALLINPQLAAPLAYIGGTLGVLIGADLLRLGNIRSMGVALASIGGAGTFDGIFITGIIAVLLT